MNRSRKLHCTIERSGVRVEVCDIDEGARPRKLVSSSDGVVAMELHRPGEGRAARWRVIGVHMLDESSEDIPYGSLRGVALVAWHHLAEPDVAAIHVVDRAGRGYTFLRTEHAPRFEYFVGVHPVYGVAPELN